MSETSSAASAGSSVELRGVRQVFPGGVVAVRAASTGAIQISGNEAACKIKVELSFDGQAFSDTLTLTNLLATQPWCSP